MLNTNKAFYVISKQAVLRQLKLWNTYLPYIKPYYAVKSNPDPIIIKWLYNGGCGFDCASPREIRLVQDAVKDIPSSEYYINDNIIYANPHKSDEDIIEVKETSVKKTVVDSVEGIDDLYNNRFRSNTKIYLRIAVDDSESSSPFSIKFGAQKSDWGNIINHIYKHLYKLDGISFHVGSGSKNPDQFRKAIELARELSVMHLDYIQKHRKIGLDIGGGFLPDENNFIAAAESINSTLKDWKKEDEYTYPNEIIAEPGRFFSSPSHTLFVPIIHKKKTSAGYSYVLNESIYGQFSSIPFDHAQPKWLAVNSSSKHIKNTTTPGKETTPNNETTPGIIFGRTCDSIDMIAYSDKMPIMNKGDYLCFPNMGAYTRASASEFNGFPTPMCIYDEYSAQVADILTTNSSLKDDVEFPIEIVSKIKLSVNN
jgi:ornithine decarboxylase